MKSEQIIRMVVVFLAVFIASYHNDRSQRSTHEHDSSDRDLQQEAALQALASPVEGAGGAVIATRAKMQAERRDKLFACIDDKHRAAEEASRAWVPPPKK